MMAGVAEVKGWKTTDGKMFGVYAEAVEHERVIQLRRTYEADPIPRISWQGFMQWAQCNADFIKELNTILEGE